MLGVGADVYWGRSPSWGAWIEMTRAITQRPRSRTVAPPRGERGLKLADVQEAYGGDIVAPPRGERGLKCCHV